MSTLVVGTNGLTERHDSLLRMLFEWGMTPSIAKAVLSKGLCNHRTLVQAAEFAQLTGQGKVAPGEGYLEERACAQILLGLFLMHRPVRRAVAKHLSKTQTMRKGAAMIAMGQLRDQLLVLVEGQIGQA